MMFVFASYLFFLSITFPSFFFLSLGPLYFYLLLLLLPMSRPPHITLFSLSLLQSILIPYSYLLSCAVLTSLCFPFFALSHLLGTLFALSRPSLIPLLLSSPVVPLSSSNYPLPPSSVSLSSSLTCLAGI